MTKREVITMLINDKHSLDSNVTVCAEIPHKTEYGNDCKGYSFDITGIDEYGCLVIDCWALERMVKK